MKHKLSIKLEPGRETWECSCGKWVRKFNTGVDAEHEKAVRRQMARDYKQHEQS